MLRRELYAPHIYLIVVNSAGMRLLVTARRQIETFLNRMHDLPHAFVAHPMFRTVVAQCDAITLSDL